jgi:hypothetical protein
MTATYGRRGRWAHAIACVGVSLVALVLIVSHRAWAAPSRVVLLQSTAASAEARHCLRLVRDELMAGGFVVAVVDAAPTADPFSLANAMRAQADAVATIGLLGDPAAARAELWILDRLGERAEVRRLPFPTDEGGRAGEVLASRAVEVLRASALRFMVESKQLEGAPPPPVAAGAPTPEPTPTATATPAAAPTPTLTTTPPAPAAGAPRRRSFALEMGVSLLASPGELDPAAVPVARVSASVAGPFVARLTFAGLGTQPRVETARGTAVVSQTLGLAELGLSFRNEHRLMPLLLLGGGVLHVATDARGIAPFVGQRDSLWSALVSAGAGVVVALGGRLAVALEVHALLAAPHPVVRFADWTPATLVRPALWTTVTLVSWL